MCTRTSFFLVRQFIFVRLLCETRINMTSSHSKKTSHSFGISEVLLLVIPLQVYSWFRSLAVGTFNLFKYAKPRRRLPKPKPI